MLHAGLRVNGTLGVIVAVAVAAALFGVLSDRADVPEAWRFGLFLGLFAVYLVVSTWYVSSRGLERLSENR